MLWTPILKTTGWMIIAKSPSFPMQMLSNTTEDLMLCNNKEVHYTQEEKYDG